MEEWSGLRSVDQKRRGSVGPSLFDLDHVLCVRLGRIQRMLVRCDLRHFSAIVG